MEYYKLSNRMNSYARGNSYSHQMRALRAHYLAEILLDPELLVYEFEDILYAPVSIVEDNMVRTPK